MPQMVNLAACAGVEPDLEAQAAALNQQMNMKLTWDDLAWVREHWHGPLLVKGICSLADAKRAHAHGADGIVVSNHGGRQLEGVPSALELLPDVADALKGRMALLVDGGVRRGSDVAKAVALGADAVLLGRAPLYGLAARGESGVDEVLAILRNELEVTLRLLGRPRIEGLDRSALRGTWRERLAALWDSLKRSLCDSFSDLVGVRRPGEAGSFSHEGLYCTLLRSVLKAGGRAARSKTARSST